MGHLEDVEARFQRTYAQWGNEEIDQGEAEVTSTQERKEELHAGMEAVETLLGQISGGYLTLKDGEAFVVNL